MLEPKTFPAEPKTYEAYEVYVDSDADEKFREFCRELGDAIDFAWKDTYEGVGDA